MLCIQINRLLTSVIVTEKEQLATFPALSVAEYLTVVTPPGKVEPTSGPSTRTIVTFTADGVGTLQVGFVLVDALEIILAGHVMTGAKSCRNSG